MSWYSQLLTHFLTAILLLIYIKLAVTGHDAPYFILVAPEICSKCQRDSHRLFSPHPLTVPFSITCIKRGWWW
jgi:hypothetical protein